MYSIHVDKTDCRCRLCVTDIKRRESVLPIVTTSATGEGRQIGWVSRRVSNPKMHKAFSPSEVKINKDVKFNFSFIQSVSGMATVMTKRRGRDEEYME